MIIIKITIIGGGSYAWMPAILPDLVRNDFFNGCGICLMDINSEALSQILAYTQKLLALRPESQIRFTTSTNLDESLDGADFVIVSVSQAGLAAEIEDHVIARKYGHYNYKGSEVGIAGASRTLRHVRETVRIARIMEKQCPNAMFLNVSNPLTAITRSVDKYTNIKAVGFCHGIKNHLQLLFPVFGAESWAEVDFNAGGVDHCSWLLDVRYKGQDALQVMRERKELFTSIENQRLRFLIWETIGYLPALSDEHCAEFFGQIMDTEERRKYYGVTYDRIEERRNAVASAKQNIGRELSPDVLKHGSGECIMPLIQALGGGGPLADILNYRNVGQIANLPLESVVETKCLVDATGIHPVIMGELPPILESIVRPVVIREELYMEAAIEENAAKLKCALATDPLVNEFRNIDELCEELMRYNIK
ncbi:MAG: hypothetical protein FWF15_10500 [Oscillospiraceae bacterium]|nr:hypothetical protein [Oscillospiraceae bacterium]